MPDHFRNTIFLFFLIFFLPIILFGSQQNQNTAKELSHAAQSFDIKSIDGKLYLETTYEQNNIDSTYQINGEKVVLNFINSKAVLEGIDLEKGGSLVFIKKDSSHKLYHCSKKKSSLRIIKIPLWLSIVPPALAIIFALLFKEVIMSLFMGVFSGAFIAGGLRFDSLYYFIISFFETINKYLISTMTDPDHLAVIIFSLLIGGMVAIISKNGGMAGVVIGLSKYAKSAVSTQFITWLIGVAIFFDDYANTLIVGNTMRNITDKFRISREKLAYIVDSTAAPVASIAFVTTWIGAELGYISDGIMHLEGFNPNLTPYAIFLSSLKYAFYPVLTLIFILIIIFLKKDFGPMYKAEFRARSTGKVASATKGVDDEPDMEDLSPAEGINKKWYNAVIPVSLVVLVTILGLVSTGMDNSFEQINNLNVGAVENDWSMIWESLGLLGYNDPSGLVKIGILIGNSNSFIALIWGSLSGMTAAIILTVGQRLMKLNDTIFAMMTGFKTMLPALVILCLAWSLAITTSELHTAEFITSAIKGIVNPYFMPMIIFVLSGLIAFSTGSSWSTMAILFPIAIPASWSISLAYGLDQATSTELLFNVIRGILGAAVLGDHVSPISDTTILSSLASDCNHLDHVKTQIPYALTVGIISIISITVAAYVGGSFLINSGILLVDVVILFFIIKYFGKKLPEIKIS